MPLKKTVAMERRIDLASLFCLISRHGPAVLVTLVVIGCSLAGFVMFRNMREKRRRKREEGAARRDSHAGYRDAGLGLGGEEEEEEKEPYAATEELSRRESTDVSDEEHGYHAHVRQRRPAPERNPYKEKLPDGDSAVNKASYSFFWQRCPPKATESHAEEPRYNCERNETHPSTEDVKEEVCGAKEPGLKNDVGYEEKEKVIEADSSEDITATAEEETVQFTFNSQLCSVPTLGENAEETNIKQQAHELKNSIVPILKPEEIPSAPHIDEEVTIEQVHNAGQQILPVQCDKPAAMPYSNIEHKADVLCRENTVSTAVSEVMEGDLVEASHNKTQASEPLVDTKDDFSLASSVNVVAHLSSNSPQTSEPLMPPTLDTEINKNGLCPQDPSHVETDTNNISNHENIGLVNTECSNATSDANKKVSHLEAGSHSLDRTEDKSLNHQEMTERVEIETSLLSANTSAVQNNQCHEILPQVENGYQSHMDKLSDQKDDISEENDLKLADLKEGQSSNVDLMDDECLVHPPTAQSQLNDMIGEETSPSGLAAVVEVISTVTDTLQTNDPKLLEGAPDLNTKTILPPALPSQISENQSNQTCQKDESMDATCISASTRDKIESMVERMVAEVYKDVKLTALEERPMHLEVNKCSELAQDNASIAPDHLTCQVVEREVVSGSNIASQSTEDNVNSVSCLNNITQVEDEVHKDVSSDVSENKSPNCCDIPVTEAVPNPQNPNHLEEESVEHLETDTNVKEISVSEDAHLAQSELVKPILNMNSTVRDNFSNESIVNVVEDVCSNMATWMQAETSTVSCPDIRDIEKVDDKAIQSSNEREIVESVTTSCQFEQQSEQNKSEVLLDIDNGECANFLEKGKGAPEIPSDIKAEVSENTATLNDVQGEQRGSEMLFDTSNSSVRRSKVVIVCRTAEASVSTIEMSDSDDVVQGETSYLELTSSRSVSCQDPIDLYRNVANEEPRADVVASTSDTITAQTVIEEMTTEEKLLTETGKPLDLTSRVALDIPQNCSASAEATRQVEQKDTPSLESGISSMAVSPEKEESSKVIGQDVLTTCQVYAEGTVSHSVFTSNGFVQVAKEESSAMETEPESSSSPHFSALEETTNELSMSNEDSFGSEIEDGYHKATEEFMTHAVDNKITSEDTTKETVKHFEKTEQACIAKKENREKVDSDKTEISIMEATMDHNEWITEGNYQVLPWMAAASFSKDLISSKEAKDVENQPQASSTEESAESAKKVLAVQPMPQNVNVTFRVHYVALSPHQTVAVTGDQPELGAWKSVVSLEKTKDGYWTCVVGLPAESHVEWKFVVLEKGEVCRWEECENRVLYTGYGDDLLVHKWWGIL